MFQYAIAGAGNVQQMTGTNRILLNTFATYARSVLSLLMGMFSVRWVLAALGKSDYGLFGVVGGIVVCIQLLNVVMSNAVARFYAFAIGETVDMGRKQGEELLMSWFNAAFSIHAFLPVLLVIIGYPIGVWAIENWLVIPSARIQACLWVFRLSILSAFFNMVSVPYIAMYKAKQLIAELTVWEMLRSVITFTGAYMLLYVETDRLIVYAAIMALAPSVVLLIQVCRARKVFGFCRVRIGCLFDREKIQRVIVFGACDLFSSLGVVVRDNGAAFVVNKVFGPLVNSAYSVANGLSSQANILASAMHGALMPAVTSFEGAGERQKAIRLSHQSCKFCTLLVLLFAIPLYMEADMVLRLWLGNPPEFAATLCRCALVSMACAKVGLGYHMSILALGKVGRYQFTLGFISYLTVPVMYFLAKAFGVVGVGYALVANSIAQSLTRVIFARSLVGVRFGYWAARILLPVLLSMALSIFAGYAPYCYMEASFARIVVTTLVVVSSLSLASWFVVLDGEERSFFLSRLHLIMQRVDV